MGVGEVRDGPNEKGEYRVVFPDYTERVFPDEFPDRGRAYRLSDEQDLWFKPQALAHHTGQTPRSPLISTTVLPSSPASSLMTASKASSPASSPMTAAQRRFA